MSLIFAVPSSAHPCLSSWRKPAPRRAGVHAKLQESLDDLFWDRPIGFDDLLEHMLSPREQYRFSMLSLIQSEALRSEDRGGVIGDSDFLLDRYTLGTREPPFGFVYLTARGLVYRLTPRGAGEPSRVYGLFQSFLDELVARGLTFELPHLNSKQMTDFMSGVRTSPAPAANATPAAATAKKARKRRREPKRARKNESHPSKYAAVSPTVGEAESPVTDQPCQVPQHTSPPLPVSETPASQHSDDGDTQEVEELIDLVMTRSLERQPSFESSDDEPCDVECPVVSPSPLDQETALDQLVASFQAHLKPSERERADAAEHRRCAEVLAARDEQLARLTEANETLTRSLAEGEAARAAVEAKVEEVRVSWSTTQEQNRTLQAELASARELSTRQRELNHKTVSALQDAAVNDALRMHQLEMYSCSEQAFLKFAYFLHGLDPSLRPDFAQDPETLALTRPAFDTLFRWFLEHHAQLVEQRSEDHRRIAELEQAMLNHAQQLLGSASRSRQPSASSASSPSGWQPTASDTSAVVMVEPLQFGVDEGQQQPISSRDPDDFLRSDDNYDSFSGMCVSSAVDATPCTTSPHLEFSDTPSSTLGDLASAATNAIQLDTLHSGSVFSGLRA